MTTPVIFYELSYPVSLTLDLLFFLSEGTDEEHRRLGRVYISFFDKCQYREENLIQILITHHYFDFSLMRPSIVLLLLSFSYLYKGLNLISVVKRVEGPVNWRYTVKWSPVLWGDSQTSIVVLWKFQLEIFDDGLSSTSVGEGSSYSISFVNRHQEV